MAETDPIDISTCTPAFLRWGLGAFGLVIFTVSAKELGPLLWPLSVLVLFPGSLFVIGMVMGALLTASMVWGPDTHWRISPNTITLTESLRSRHHQCVYTSSEINRIDIETIDRDSGPNLYGLVVTLHSGHTLKSPPFAKLGAAETAKNMILAG